jgi:hypothetical protein
MPDVAGSLYTLGVIDMQSQTEWSRRVFGTALSAIAHHQRALSGIPPTGHAVAPVVFRDTLTSGEFRSV